MRIRAIVTSFILVLLMSSLALAQVYYARESFDYPLGTPIDTLMGAAANGWAGAWYKNMIYQENAAVVSDQGLNYDDLSYAVPHYGNHLETVPDPLGTEQRYSRQLDKNWPNEAGKKYWISVVMNVKNATDNATWLGVKYYVGDTGELCMLGKGHGLDKYTLGSGWHGGEGPEVSSVAWTDGPVWLVGMTSMQGADNTDYDTTYMWINPDPYAGEPELSMADAVSLTSMKSGFNTIRIEFGGSVGDGLSASFDELRLGTSWGDVSSEIYLARESFEYPIGTAIDTLMGAAANGWAGAWYKNMIYQENAAVVSAEGLNYDDLSYSVPNLGYHLESVPDPLGTEQRYSRQLDKNWPNETGRDYWISLVMNVKNATDNATWLGVKYYVGDTGELCMLGKGHGLDKYTLGSGWHGGEGPEVSSVAWTDGPVWLVGMTSMQGAESTDYDTTYMWINPDPYAGEPELSMADAVALTSMKSGFNTIRIEFGGSVGDGLSASFDEIRLGTTWDDVASELEEYTAVVVDKAVPSHYELSQNYPNPFNPTTNITYALKSNGRIHLAVYDVLGREVAVLADGVQYTGSHTITFSGKDLTSGIYFYKLQTADEVFVKKMVLIK